MLNIQLSRIREKKNLRTPNTTRYYKIVYKKAMSTETPKTVVILRSYSMYIIHYVTEYYMKFEGKHCLRVESTN